MNFLHLNIGSNKNRRINIRLALNKLKSNFTDITVSSIFESPAEGFVGSNFYNVGVNAKTKNNINEVVGILHDIENSLGRDRSLPKFSSRIIDLDLVLYNDAIDEDLKVPRRDILKYAFVLAPLAELSPEDIHPQKGISFLNLWEEFQSNKDFELNQYNIDKLFG
ncbi:MAG: 2-amino-4-hydroxy-6-hydroxymethyldihydropteridine diphosphokinase [Candidatus Pseudothioglobus sp.]|jgi:2-amino-4-hydroxy-6-hydroxymethyldihydropteridine diphosphokinase